MKKPNAPTCCKSKWPLKNGRVLPKPADRVEPFWYRLVMSHDSLELNEARAAYFDRWEAVEAAKAQELAAMTEERARQIIQSLGAVEGWRERLDWSGLVEQQAVFHRGRHA
jgi:hypothetical protein